MADLSQAMRWLAEGKKIRKSDWLAEIYLYLKDGYLRAHEGQIYFPESDWWEIFEEPEQIVQEPEKTALDPLVADADYIVWSEDGDTRTFAYWLADEFYGIYDGHSIPLKVGRYKKLPSYEEAA